MHFSKLVQDGPIGCRLLELVVGEVAGATTHAPLVIQNLVEEKRDDLSDDGDDDDDDDDDDDRFTIALFSALEQNHCAFIAYNYVVLNKRLSFI